MNCNQHKLNRICENCRNAGKRFPCILSRYRVTLRPILAGTNVKQDLIAFMRRHVNPSFDHSLHTYWTLVVIKEVAAELAPWYEKMLVLL